MGALAGKDVSGCGFGEVGGVWGVPVATHHDLGLWALGCSEVCKGGHGCGTGVAATSKELEDRGWIVYALEGLGFVSADGPVLGLEVEVINWVGEYAMVAGPGDR